MSNTAEQDWRLYCQTELTLLEPILIRHGFTLEFDQPHLKGERFLMQAATTAGGKKLILFATTEQERVVIKATRDTAGRQELQHERRCREVLHQLKFAAEIFHTPPEVAWITEEDFTISVHQCIDQVSTFLERPLEEQFDFALSAFKAQEGTHATTSSHHKLIKGVYPLRDSQTYLKQTETFLADITRNLPKETELHTQVGQAKDFLLKHQTTIEQYCGFLTHTDFVPHNIRIDSNGTMFLLDHSSITFGSKHESWARFINFMTLYNPPLADALTQYVAENRAPEEQQSLRLMRVYRLGELMWYYQHKLPLSEGNLYKLNHARIFFWAAIQKHVLEDTSVPAELIEEYQATRDNLRSETERERQKNLH